MKCKSYNCNYTGKANKYVNKYYDKCPKCNTIQLKDSFKDYNIVVELNSSQSLTVRKALEMYSRTLMGQLDISLEPIIFNKLKDSYNSDKVQELILELKKELFGINGEMSNMGIYNKNIDDSARESWDIYQVLRNIQSWTENPEGGFFTNYDKPLKTSIQPLPKCYVNFKNKKDKNDIAKSI